MTEWQQCHRHKFHVLYRDRKEVAFMVARILELPGPGEAGDASDALAVALCLACVHTGAVVPS